MMTHLLAAILATAFSGTDGAASTGEVSVEDAARAFRIQVYQSFHLDRDEFDRRRAEWRQLESAWIEAGKPESEAHLLVSWLEEATDQSKPDSAGPLPELPKIVAAPKAERGDYSKSRGPATAASTEHHESPNDTDDLSPAVNKGDSTKTTTVSSRRNLDDPTAGEKAPDETAPVPSPAVTGTRSTSNATIGSSARAGAPAAVWYHRFEHWLGEEIDAFAPDPATPDRN